MSGASDPTLDEQRRFWNWWDREHVEERDAQPDRINLTAEAKAEAVLSLVSRTGVQNGALLEVGCATGWFTERLLRYGTATGIDLADEVLTRSRERRRELTLISGDVMSHPFPAAGFDVIVTMDVLSHVVDQAAFIARLTQLLKPGGHLVVLTQNRFVFERRGDVAPLAPGQIRHWLTRRELRALLSRFLVVRDLVTILPAGHQGVLRVVNSVKLNNLAGAVGLDRALTRLRERAGLGQSLVALAQRQS